MAKDLTGTYQQAKDIYLSCNNMQDYIINVDSNDVRIFRKHLTEFEYRRKEGKRFITVLLDKTRILVKRIK